MATKGATIGSLRWIAGVALAMAALGAHAQHWIEIGVDPEAKFFVDTESIEPGKDSVRVTKRGVYNHVLTEILGGRPTVFRQTLGIIELDCKLRVNRVIKIDMLDDNGEIVWSSGLMPKRMWEGVRPNSHAAATLDYVCGRINL
ncbi:MAG: surface-adhesin E family protein [Burkholderiales bacterium]